MYEWVEHTAEVELVIHAATEEAVFEEALLAFAELVARDPTGPPARHDVEAAAADRASLLAAWLEEFLYLAETEAFVPVRLARFDLAADRLRATVAGYRDRPAPLVKAVTYHRLAFAPAGDGYRARLVLDV
jgi:SHS2 domain-containing protein